MARCRFKVVDNECDNDFGSWLCQDAAVARRSCMMMLI
jgi:hypothetical protein